MNTKIIKLLKIVILGVVSFGINTVVFLTLADHLIAWFDVIDTTEPYSSTLMFFLRCTVCTLIELIAFTITTAGCVELYEH